MQAHVHVPLEIGQSWTSSLLDWGRCPESKVEEVLQAHPHTPARYPLGRSVVIFVLSLILVALAVPVASLLVSAWSAAAHRPHLRRHRDLFVVTPGDPIDRRRNGRAWRLGWIGMCSREVGWTPVAQSLCHRGRLMMAVSLSCWRSKKGCGHRRAPHRNRRLSRWEPRISCGLFWA